MTRALGLIAAAGRSERMGEPKALLSVPRPPPLSTEPLALYLAGIFADGGCDDVVITVPPRSVAPTVRPALEREARGRVRIEDNTYWDAGLIGSIATAIEIAADDVDTLVFSPVDAPHTTIALVRALIERRRATDADAAAVEVEGARGHPVAVSRRLFAALKKMEDGGAKAVFERAHVSVVDWMDARVTLNVNTPADWKLARAGLAEELAAG